MSFLHGIRVTEVKNQSRSIATIATAVIGLVATAPAAVADAFPLDTAVKVTNLDDAIEKAGATGTLRAALVAIRGQVSAPVVVVRVAPGADAAATTAAIIGTDVAGVKTGLQALLTASAQLDMHPRIIGAPGLESELVTKALVTVARKLRAQSKSAGVIENTQFRMSSFIGSFWSGGRQRSAGRKNPPPPPPPPDGMTPDEVDFMKQGKSPEDLAKYRAEKEAKK